MTTHQNDDWEYLKELATIKITLSHIKIEEEVKINDVDIQKNKVNKS